MKYSEKALATIKGKKFIIGMMAAGVISAGLAWPAGTDALSVGEASNGGSATGSFGLMITGNLQGGGSWNMQSLSGNNRQSLSGTGNGQAGGKGAGQLSVNHMSDGAGSNSASNASTAGEAQTSGGGSAETQSQNSTADDQGGSSTGAASLQGGAGLNVSLMMTGSSSRSDSGLLGL